MISKLQRLYDALPPAAQGLAEVDAGALNAGLAGDVEDDVVTSELLDMWNAEEPSTEDDAFEQWQSKRETTETVSGS